MTAEEAKEYYRKKMFKYVRKIIDCMNNDDFNMAKMMFGFYIDSQRDLVRLGGEII